MGGLGGEGGGDRIYTLYIIRAPYHHHYPSCLASRNDDTRIIKEYIDKKEILFYLIALEVCCSFCFCFQSRALKSVSLLHRPLLSRRVNLNITRDIMRQI